MMRAFSGDEQRQSATIVSDSVSPWDKLSRLRYEFQLRQYIPHGWCCRVPPLVLFVIRTAGMPWRNRPCRPLATTVLSGLIVLDCMTTLERGWSMLAERILPFPSQ
jgi:hypothetical protein